MRAPGTCPRASEAPLWPLISRSGGHRTAAEAAARHRVRVGSARDSPKTPARIDRGALGASQQCLSLPREMVGKVLPAGVSPVGRADRI